MQTEHRLQKWLKKGSVILIHWKYTWHNELSKRRKMDKGPDQGPKQWAVGLPHHINEVWK